MDAFELLSKLYLDVLEDLDILAGNSVGPSAASWQDVAGTASVNLRSLASALELLRAGGPVYFRGSPVTGPIVFPDVGELLDLTPGPGAAWSQRR